MQPLVIVGGGASIRPEWANGLFGKIADKAEIWSVNSAFKCMPYLPDKELYIDKSFFMASIDDLERLHKQGVEIVGKAHWKSQGLATVIKQFNTSNIRADYFGKDAIKRGIIYTGGIGLSGFFALSYAIALNIHKEIYLLGYDFGTPKPDTMQTHFYQQEINDLHIYTTGAGKPHAYRKKDSVAFREEDIKDWEVYLKETDVEIWNVSMISNIQAFPKITYKEFYDRLYQRNEIESCRIAEEFL